jgi:hypothetical protein
VNRQEILALSDERDRECAARQQAREWWYRLGFTAGAQHDHHAGQDCQSAIRDSYAAGQRSTASSDLQGFDAGYAAALDRFADLIGGRLKPARPTALEIKRWTRHAPRCRHGGHNGSQSCQRAGCIPGPRADAGKRAPWDRPPLDPSRVPVDKRTDRAEPFSGTEYDDSTGALVPAKGAGR